MMFAVHKNYWIYIFSFMGLWLSLPLAAMPSSEVKIAIVIDDMGYRQSDRNALNIKGNFTYAILPFAPLTKELAFAAHAKNREILAHIPREALANNHLLGLVEINSSMNQQQINRQLQHAINNVPYAQGINNHMGSKLTTLAKPMRWIMALLSQQQLYFLDSKTSATSIAASTAKKFGLATAQRDVFLDNQLDLTSLNKQFDQLIKIAKKHKSAIGIAHPHPQTIAFLAKISARLTKLNIKLVPLSEVLSKSKKKELKTKSDYTELTVF